MKEEYEDIAKYGTLVGVVSLILAFNLPEQVGKLVSWARGLIDGVAYFIASSVILATLVSLADIMIRKHQEKKEEKNKPIASFSG